MLFWLLIFIGAILVYVAICFVIDKWFVPSKELSIPVMLFIAPILVFLKKKDQWESSRKGKAKKKVAEKPYNISESTVRRIEREGITYREKN